MNSEWILNKDREKSVFASLYLNCQLLRLWWNDRLEFTRKKSSALTDTASTQGCVSTANSYLTKCPKAAHAICSMLLQMSSNVFCSILKLKGSSGSQHISSIIRNAEKPTGRKGSPFLTRVQPVFWKAISLFFRNMGYFRR